MSVPVWRVRPLAVPVWPAPCARCASPFLESSGRFRVNSNGRLHDVWLLYRCPRCGDTRKRSLHRRVREDALAVPLDLYRRDDRATAERHAFALSPGQAVAYAVERPALPVAGCLRARIAQPLPCGVRWDRFLAGELAWSRSRVVAAWRSGAVRVEPASRPSHAVRDGDTLEVRLAKDGLW